LLSEGYQSDSAKLAKHAPADILFVPKGSSFNPPDFATAVEVSGPTRALRRIFVRTLSRCCNGRHQIAIASMPDVAIFGEKDYNSFSSCVAQ